MPFARAFPLLLLLTLPAAAQDASARYKQFFYDIMQFRWPNEELSEQRVVMLRNFEKHDVPEAADWLMTEVLPKDDAADVLREAVRILAGYKSPETVAAMSEILDKRLKKPVESRALAILACSRTQQAEGLAVLEQALKEKNEFLLLSALRGVRESNRTALKEEVAKFLKHKHAMLRGAAIDCLVTLRAEEMLPGIFGLFVSDPSARVRYDAWLALKQLSLEDLPCDPMAWEEWWGRRAAGGGEGAWGPFPRIKEETGTSGFFGIPVCGERIAFVIDVSQDMDNPWMVDHAAERAKPKEEQIPNFFSVKTRWNLVVNHLKRCLDGLPDKTEVAFVFYNHEFKTWPENNRFFKLAGKNRDKIYTHLEEEVERRGSTAIYEALKAGWGFLRGGNAEINFDRGCDTIVFVTDGQNHAGELAKRPDRLLDEVWLVATTRGVRIHSVGIHNHDFALCSGMAKVSGGLYVHAQQSDDTAEPQDLDFWPKKKKAFEEARKKKGRQ